LLARALLFCKPYKLICLLACKPLNADRRFLLGGYSIHWAFATRPLFNRYRRRFRFLPSAAPAIASLTANFVYADKLVSFAFIGIGVE
jgi:hypothetical protein